MAHSQGSWRKKRLSAKGQAPSGRFEESTLYSNTYPWINESGREYASSWNFTFISDVYTGGTVWEVESSAEEDEVVERPVVKAKSVPSPKVAPVSKAASSSSRDLGALPKGGPVPKATGPRQPVTPPKAGPKHVAVPKAAPQQSRPKASVAPSQQLQPRRCILPDQVVLITRENIPNQEVQLQQNSRFVRQADTRGFDGYWEFFDPNTNERPNWPLSCSTGIRFLIGAVLKQCGRSIVFQGRT